MSEFFDYTNFEEISPEKTERKSLRRGANACGLALIALFAVMFGWSFPVLKILSLLGFSLKDSANFLSEPFMSQLLGILLSGIMIVLPFFVAAKFSHIKTSAELPFKTAEKGLFFPAVFIGVAFCLFSSFGVAMGGQVFRNFGIEFPSTEVTFPNGVFGVIISMLSTAFFPAFFEELALRGFALTILRRNGDVFAVFSSAIIFGFMHANFDQIVFAFLVGLVLGFITVKTQSIWAAVAVHFINNLNSVVFSYISQKYENLASLLLIAVLALWVFLGIIGFAILQKRKPEFFKTEKEEKAEFSKKLRWFLTTPAIIISIIISLLLAFFAR